MAETNSTLNHDDDPSAGDFEQEEWRPVVGYEGGYIVSRYGEVQSMIRIVTRSNGIKFKSNGRVIRQTLDKKTGYFKVKLCDSRGQVTRSVHSLVAEAFIGKPDGKIQVRHLDGNKRNNALSNLAYGTQSDNEKDKVLLGRDNKGSKSPNAKLSDDVVVQMRVMADQGATHDDIAKKYGVGRPTATKAIRRLTWAHVQ